MKYWTKARKFLTRAKRLYPDGITFSEAKTLYGGGRHYVFRPCREPAGLAPGGAMERVLVKPRVDNMLMGKLLVCNARPTVGSGCPGNRWIITNNVEPPYFTKERLAAGNAAAKKSKRVWRLKRLLARQDEMGIDEMVEENLHAAQEGTEAVKKYGLKRVGCMAGLICTNRTEFEQCDAVAAHLEVNCYNQLVVNGKCWSDKPVECPRCGALLAVPTAQRVREVLSGR